MEPRLPNLSRNELMPDFKEATHVTDYHGQASQQATRLAQKLYEDSECIG